MLKISLILSIVFSRYTLLSFFFLWLIRDYPAWRQNNLSVNSQQQHGCTSSSYTSAETSANTSANTNKEALSLSILHYIIGTPVAVLYILVRAAVDTLRLCIFWWLWSIEQLIPKIDDWLFDNVTVWLPAKIAHWERWWNHRGIYLWRRGLHSLQTTVLPAMTELTEQCFETLFTVSTALYQGGLRLHSVLHQLTRKYAWKQMIMDSMTVLEKSLRNPTAQTVYRVYHLCVLIWRAFCHTLLSLKEDTEWAVHAFLSTATEYIGSTRLMPLLHCAISWSLYHSHQLLGKLLLHFTVPFLERLSKWAIDGIEYTNTFLQSDQFQSLWLQWRQLLLSNSVWIVTDGILHALLLLQCLNNLFSKLIFPTTLLFMQYAVPALSDTYQHYKHLMLVVWNGHIYPSWLQLYSYLQQPLFSAGCKLYERVIIPTAHGASALLLHGINICQHVFSFGYPMSVMVYRLLVLNAIHIKQWLVLFVDPTSLLHWFNQHIPLFSHVLEKTWVFVHRVDWGGLQKNALSLYWRVHFMFFVQLDVLFVALERMLMECVHEQDMDKTRTK